MESKRSGAPSPRRPIPGPELRFHHLGVACDDIAAELARIRSYHDVREVSDVVTDDAQQATLCMVTLSDGLQLELISGPTVAKLRARGVTYYHVCYATPDLEAAARHLTSAGALPVSPAKPARLFAGRRVAFYYLSYGLVEIVEEER